MNSGTLISTGVILLTVVAVAWGGTFLVRVATGAHPVNELQRSYFRAGHAHAGVLIILGLVVRLLLNEPGVPVWSSLLADGILIAAILMPAAFYLDPRAHALAALTAATAAVLSTHFRRKGHRP